jgi:hypothetical protein
MPLNIFGLVKIEAGKEVLYISMKTKLTLCTHRESYDTFFKHQESHGSLFAPNFMHAP